MHNRTNRLKPGVVLLHLPVLVENPHELTEVRVFPVAAGAFALLEDRVDCLLRRAQVGDGHELGPAEVLRGRLRARRAHKELPFTKFLR